MISFVQSIKVSQLESKEKKRGKKLYQKKGLIYMSSLQGHFDKAKYEILVLMSRGFAQEDLGRRIFRASSNPSSYL